MRDLTDLEYTYTRNVKIQIGRQPGNMETQMATPREENAATTNASTKEGEQRGRRVGNTGCYRQEV